MAPCCLAGVLAAHCWQISEKRSPLGALGLWLGRLAVLWGYHVFDLMRVFSEGFVVRYLGAWAHKSLYFSRDFAADWLLSAAIITNFIAARQLGAWLHDLKADSLNWVELAGGLTYALKIIHFHFFYIWSALLYSLTSCFEKYLAVLGLALISVGITVISRECLRSRMRKWFKSALGNQAFSRWLSKWVSKSA